MAEIIAVIIADMYLLECGEAPQTGLRRIVLEKIDESIALLTNSGFDPEIAVHDVRKNVKRIRAALRLARFGMDEADYRRENGRFRDLGRRLAAAREAAALAGTLERILQAGGLPDAEIDRLSRIVLGRMDKDQAAALDPGRVLIAELAAGFRAAADQVTAFELPVSRKDFIRSGLVDTMEKARAGFDEASSIPESAETFHEWRKQVKYLWHQFELLAAHAEPSNEVLIEDLEHLSEQLGLAHDVANLHGKILLVSSEWGAGEIGSLARRVRRVRRDHEGAAIAHGRVIFGRQAAVLLDWYPNGG
jgi:CHAD domain-containing protein